MFFLQNDDAVATFLLNMFETGLHAKAQPDQVKVFFFIIIFWGGEWVGLFL